MRNIKQERPRPIRVLLLCPAGSPLEESIGDYFNAEDRFPISIVATAVMPERCRSLVREVYPNVVLLVAVGQLEEWTTHLLQLSKDLNLDYPNLATVILTDAKPDEMNAYYEKALSVGVRGVVNVGRLGEGMVGAFSDIERAIMQAYQFIRHRADEFSARLDLQVLKVITVAGGKGGVGKSTIATALAGEIARQQLDKRVVLIDFDIQYGAVAPMLGISKAHNSLTQLAALSLADLANIQNHNDIADFVQLLPVGNGTNLFVLAAPTSPLDLAVLPPEKAAEILSTLRRAFDYVVIDLPTQITDASLAAFQASQLLLLVCEPEMLAVRACRQLLQLLRDPTVGNPQAEIKLVLNKVWGKREQNAWGLPLIKVSDVEKLFTEPVAARFPLDTAFINEHISSGKPIGSWETKSAFLKELNRFCRDLGLGSVAKKKTEPTQKNKPSRLASLWGPTKG